MFHLFKTKPTNEPVTTAIPQEPVQNEAPAVTEVTQNAQKPKAIAFVDFEYWLFSLQNQFHMRPDAAKWVDELKKTYDVTDVRFFGDFSSEIMSKELPKIRLISNQIIETKNGSENHKKDFTDFIMLDSIYQASIFEKDVNTFILFTGDGHFNSAAAFLKNTLGKKVVIYGIQNTFSNALKAIASSWVEMPSENSVFETYYLAIFQYIAYLERQNSTFRPTFNNTVKALESHNQLDASIAAAALRQLIANEFISVKTESVKLQQNIKVLVPNWEKAIASGYWIVDN